MIDYEHGPNNWAVQINGGYDPIPGNDFGVSSWRRLAITKAADNTLIFYHSFPNGLVRPATYSVASDPFPTTTANAAIGNWNHTTDRNWQGQISFLFVWNRGLSSRERISLGRLPYQMFAPVRRRTYLLPTEPSASAGSSGTGVITFMMG